MDREEQTTVVRDETVRDDRGVADVRQETVTRNSTADGRTVAQRVVWYIAGFIIALLGLRVLLFLLGANRESGFVDFLYAITQPFAAPFYGIFPQPAYGQFALDTASIVAMIVYALIAWAIAKLFTLTSARRDV